MTDTPSWQSKLVEKYYNKVRAFGDTVTISRTDFPDFLAAIQSAYDLGIISIASMDKAQVAELADKHGMTVPVTEASGLVPSADTGDVTPEMIARGVDVLRELDGYLHERVAEAVYRAMAPLDARIKSE